jgi:phospholipid/cholesterol/gamma-HCH transport system substrate-binding protein
MESKVNYIVVGIFIVLFSIGAIVFVIWLENYGAEEDFRYYKTYMSESVSGLGRDSSVKYRGVDVGTVETIHINPNNTEEVEILLRVKKDTPIKTDMVARLKFYGLTGLAFVEIEGGSKESPLLKSEKDEIPIIKSSPSPYTRLIELLPDIGQNLSNALTKIDILLNENNLTNIQQSVENIKEISIFLKNYEDDIETLLANSTDASEKIVLLVNKVADTADAIKQMANSIEKSILQGDYNLKELSSDTFIHANELLEQINNLTIELEEMVSSIQRNPREFFFRQTTPKLGPGETNENR